MWRVCFCEQINENSNNKKKRVTQTVTRLVCDERTETIDAQSRDKRVTVHVTRLFVVGSFTRTPMPLMQEDIDCSLEASKKLLFFCCQQNQIKLQAFFQEISD